jgi:hypothetical protein
VVEEAAVVFIGNGLCSWDRTNRTDLGDLVGEWVKCVWDQDGCCDLRLVG